MCLRLDRSDEAFKPKVVNNLLKKYAVKSGNSLIFCERKTDVQRMSSSLSDCYHIKSESLHSDVPQHKRERAYRDFKSGQLKCIIATNVAARGLDFP
jgi:superfamily II DNA/RNA helicase